MALVVGSLVSSKSFLGDYYVSKALIAGQVVIRDTALTGLGEVTDPGSTSSAANVMGVTIDAATSVTSPTKEPGTLLVNTSGLENIVKLNVDPHAIYRFQLSASTVSGVALNAVSPANILTVTVADTVAPFATITAGAPVGTASDMSGGLIKGRTGNNAGSIRKLISKVDSTSVTVGIGFLNATAVGDTFIRTPFSRQVIAMLMTTDFTQANSIPTDATTGAVFRVVNVIIDEQNSLAWVDVVSASHFYIKS
jgi:hypothetical protein